VNTTINIDPQILTLEKLEEKANNNYGILEPHDVVKNNILRHAGFRIFDGKLIRYLIGTNVLTKELLASVRKDLFIEKTNLSEETCAVLTELPFFLVHEFLDVLGILFRDSDLFKHFTKAPVYREANGDKLKRYSINFKDWHRAYIVLGGDFVLKRVMKEKDLKHLVSIVHGLLEHSDNVFNGIEYSIDSEYVLSRTPAVSHAELCISEIIKDISNDELSYESEWMLREQHGISQYKYPYLLCAKRNVGTSSEPKLAVKAVYSDFKSLHKDFAKHSNRSFAIINLGAGLNQYLNDNEDEAIIAAISNGLNVSIDDLLSVSVLRSITKVKI
jgi:hypothetical protein